MTAGAEQNETKVRITPRGEDFSRWYTDVIAAAEMADYSPVKGCMVIRPWGYAIWELMAKSLDGMLKDSGHQNAYFPLLIPESFLHREAEHVEGFSPELAVVTHAGGKDLEENLVIRPTSETIIYDSFAKWIKSWRDLPLLINQWANVVRWEMRTRMFLRTTEFLWQEGHTAHASHEEAEREAGAILETYRSLVEETMAVPVIAGVKSEREKFAGAVRTYAIEAMMQDRKALQCGTSHDLGQNFSRAFGVRFLDSEGKEQHAWQTSWGVSTRLIGALIMVHGDDRGIILPPRIAPLQAVIVPIWKNDAQRDDLTALARTLAGSLGASGVRCRVDERDVRPAWKYYEWERKGVPVRVELGPRDAAERQVMLVRRDTNEKSAAPQDGLPERMLELLAKIQNNLFVRAGKFRDENTFDAGSWEELTRILGGEGGFVRAWWCGTEACESRIKTETKATIRCIPSGAPSGSGSCVSCGAPASLRPVFALSY
ncbi:MAG TPA: proline--tRNA ligase [Bacteroidota bacterium]|nr:proline--tRNA ligase [Bacteroidota bacterium]